MLITYICGISYIFYRMSRIGFYAVFEASAFPYFCTQKWRDTWLGRKSSDSRS